MKTVIRNSYTPRLGDYCETVVVDKETGTAYIFDEDGVFTELDQTDVEDILARAAAYTDEQVAPLAEKLDTIEEGAQVNKIEHILRNGTELTITNKTVNVTVPTKTSDLTNDGSDGTDTYVESAALDDYYTKTETDTNIGYETDAREIADAGLQEQIDAIVASSDVVDIVGTYAALQAYDTSKLHDNDIIKVLTDETRDGATTYYRWDADTSTWSYIGAEGPFYTKAESDAIFTPMTRTINSKALSSDIILTAADVGALPDSTVIPTVNDATLTIQQNGATVQTFTANQATNATANITVPTDTADLTNGAGYITSAALPTKTSDLTNDGSDGTSTYVEADDLAAVATTGAYSDLTGTPTLATVATSGDYDDLINKPTIPTVNDATLTIQKNGTDVATFTANSATNQTANITVPTDTLDLTNGAGFITTAALTDYYTKSETYSQGEVNSLINAITVPTKTSDLTNDGSDGNSTYVEADDLATVATTGDYDNLTNKPTLPTDFTGATSSTAGSHGLVPAPAAGDEGKFLQGDGTWATVTPGQTYTAGSGINIDANNEISVDTTVVATQTDLAGKQDTLTAGMNISISGNTISASIPVDSALDVSSTNPVENSVVTAALNNKADTSDLANYVTLDTNQNITGEKTFVGNKRIKFKGTASNSKLGFTSFDQNNGETGFLEVEGLSTGSKKVRLGCYDTASGGSTRDNYVGFQYHNTRAAGGTVSYNLVCPPQYKGVSGTSAYAYIPVDFTDGNTTVRADNTGVLNLSTLLPSYSDFTGATSSTAGANGLVPAPAAGDEGKYLKGDGTWATVQSGESVTRFYVDLDMREIAQDDSVCVYKDVELTTIATGDDIGEALLAGGAVLVYRFSSSPIEDDFYPIIRAYKYDSMSWTFSVAQTTSKSIMLEMEELEFSRGTFVVYFGKIEDGDIRSSAVTTSTIASNAVTTAKIADGAVTSAKIADGTIATGDIANNAVTEAKIDWTTTSVTLTRASTNIGTVGETHCKKFGKITLLNLNFNTTASTSGVIYTGAPAPAARLTVGLCAGDSKGYRLFINTDGSIQTDGTIAGNIWLSGCVMYFAA